MHDRVGMSDSPRGKPGQRDQGGRSAGKAPPRGSSRDAYPLPRGRRREGGERHGEREAVARRFGRRLPPASQQAVPRRLLGGRLGEMARVPGNHLQRASSVPPPRQEEMSFGKGTAE